MVFQHFLADLSPQLTLKTDLTHRHQSLRQHVKLVRVANAHVRSLDEVDRLHLKPRRVWIGLTDPSSLHWSLESEADEALQVWAKLLVSTPFTLSMSPATRLEITATADAMASGSMAGFGGAAFFPNMNVIYSPWTQLTYHVHTVVHSSLMSFTTCSIDCAFLRRFRFQKDLHGSGAP